MNMTVDEMKIEIRGHCYGRTCDTCPLLNKTICYTHATDKQIEENYKLIFGGRINDK